VQVILFRLAKLHVVLLLVRTIAVVPVQNLPRSTTGHTSIHTPRLNHPSIVVYADVAFAEPSI
jgi:hypothetical protein